MTDWGKQVTSILFYYSIFSYGPDSMNEELKKIAIRRKIRTAKLFFLATVFTV